jgi:hypothetical protein
VNLLGHNTDTRNKNAKTWTDVSKNVHLEINVEKLKYMMLAYH